jgi:two-component system OmpR family sensor kinase
MSLRLRLALITLAVVAGALVIANIAIARYVQSFLQDRTDEQLARATSGAPFVGLRDAPVPPRPTGEQFQSDDFQVRDVFIARCAADGKLIDGQFVFGSEASPPLLSDDACVAGPSRNFNVDARDGTPFRARSASSELGGGRVVIAQATSDTSETLDTLLVVQIIASAAVLAGALALVWWLIGVGLRPLRRIETTATAIASGDLSQRIGNADHRTEIGRLGASLNGMLAEIEDAFAAKEASEGRLRQFVADASHELRTPLATVRGYAELLSSGVDHDEQAIAARRILEHGVRMSELVDALLTLARLDEHQPLATEHVDLVTLAADVVADVQALEPTREVSITAPDRPAPVIADRKQLGQVLTNLISNGCRHTPDGTPIEVIVRERDGWTRVVVADRGPGVPPEARATLFDRFVRVDTSRSRQSGGAGLGLAIVAAIVDAHGGQYGVDDRAGGGSEFWVDLPRPASADDPQRAGSMATASA